MVLRTQPTTTHPNKKINTRGHGQQTKKTLSANVGVKRVGHHIITFLDKM